MRPFGVVPDEPVSQFVVQLTRILEEMLMMVKELFLERAIEPLGMGVHLRRPWIRVPVGNLPAVELLREAFHELAAVVGQHVFDLVGKNVLEYAECFRGGL